jgi:hypothetical protein
VVDECGATRVVDIVVAVVADMPWGSVVDGIGGSPVIATFFGVKVPVDGRRWASSHRGDASGE